MKKIKIFPMILLICVLLSGIAPCAWALDSPKLNGKAAILVDLDSGKMLYGYNEDEQRAPASMTKVMTVLLALDAIDAGRCDLGTMVTAQEDCRAGMEEDSSSSGILPGMELSMRDLLYCALLQSANEACNIIGRYLGGSVKGFVEQMNQKAEELGCSNTHFVNTNGLPAEGHYSSARDIATIFSAALEYPLFSEIIDSTSYQPENSAINEGMPIGNSNALINITATYSYNGRYLYEGAHGGKTGYTRAAGYCLVSSAERDGVRVLSVVMGCDGPLNADIEECYSFVDARALYDWAFDGFSYRTVISSTEPITKVNVDMAEGDGMVMLYPASDVRLLMPKDVSDDVISRSTVIYDQRLVAPLAAGTVLGEIQLSADGESYGSVKLITTSDVELSRSAYLKERLGEIFSKGWVIALLIIVLAFVLIYTVLVVRYRRLRRRHLEERRRAEQRRRAQRQRERSEAGGYTTLDPSERFDIGADMSDYFDDRIR
ncbi:MAG: D-alanyl-D-alanine carboxypeptidase family protein [Candidatus Limivicinus sp.]|nr:D-alanyl-D-alanine carboxypeptidase [Clostridiales bacterium]MDY3860517.1 D-alanyl-D-alanine carboxypeptidase family protein [Candidatus Limivicinus sp.]